MFADIEMKTWKKEFHFQNTKESMLKLKYTNRWFFPVMLAMTMILLSSFLVFVILFFIISSSPFAYVLYSALVLIFILCWTGVYFAIQKKATAPYSAKANGYLIFTENKLIIKLVLKNSVKECSYSYDEIDRVFFNRRTCGLALLDNKKRTIFNEIVPFEDVADILNLLYNFTNIKPKIT